MPQHSWLHILRYVSNNSKCVYKILICRIRQCRYCWKIKRKFWQKENTGASQRAAQRDRQFTGRATSCWTGGSAWLWGRNWITYKQIRRQNHKHRRWIITSKYEGIKHTNKQKKHTLEGCCEVGKETRSHTGKKRNAHRRKERKRKRQRNSKSRNIWEAAEELEGVKAQCICPQKMPWKTPMPMPPV